MRAAPWNQAWVVRTDLGKVRTRTGIILVGLVQWMSYNAANGVVDLVDDGSIEVDYPGVSPFPCTVN